MKKKMYYNMKIKSIQIQFSTLEKLLKRAKNIKLDFLNEDLSYIEFKQKQIDLNLDKTFLSPNTYNLKNTEIQTLDNIYQSMKHKLFETSKYQIQKLMTELETGGNIRLEEGKPSDKWYQSCKDLVLSRFSAGEMQQFDIKSIDIKRVVRIHNRFLRNKFEEKVETLVDVSNLQYKKQVEYYFYGADMNNQYEIYSIIEDGFTNQYNKYTKLVNSIFLAENPRLQQYIRGEVPKYQREHVQKLCKGQNFVAIPPGCILICKVLMVSSKQDSKHSTFDPSKYPADIIKQYPLETDESDIYYRISISNPNHKMWFIQQNSLVLPEYLVEFEYIMNNELQNKLCDFDSEIGVLDNFEDQFISPMNLSIYKTQIDKIYNTLVEDLNAYQSEEHTIQIKAADLDRSEISQLKIILLNFFKFCLSRSVLYEMNPNLLQEQTTEVDIQQYIKDNNLQQQVFINFSNLKVINIQLKQDFLENIQYLYLSYNHIHDIQLLKHCKYLKILDLSHNFIVDLDSLQNLMQLESLDVSNNDISNIQVIYMLKNIKLKSLKVFGNAFFKTDVFQQICDVLKDLQLLNNNVIQQKANQSSQVCINDQLLKDNMNISIQSDIPWQQQVENINLSHLKLKNISNLQLKNLRTLNLSHNKIVKIENLEDCPLLEEISLEKNKIAKIENLNQLKYLKKLELGKNKIKFVENLDNLQNLMQISLEDNQIEILEDFPDLKNLMELYLGNNLINDQNQIKNLTHLNKLIICDLSNNPIQSDPNYRNYVLFLLKKLKVFDGFTIELQEQQQAKELFTGRLTQDILELRIDNKPKDQIVDLDLSSCNLRDFDDIFNNNEFPQLSELNLAFNNFQSTKMLGHLPNLKILILHQNKIEKLTGSDYNNKNLNGCQNLQILDLSQNQLRSLDGLQNCKLNKIKILKLYKNEITKLENLDQLKNLNELDICQNKVRQFEAHSFNGLVNLKCLKIDDNNLRTFNYIQKLNRIQHIFANNNRLQDLIDIDALIELQNLKEIEMSENPLAKRPGYRNVILKKLVNLVYLDGRQVIEDLQKPQEQQVQQIDIKNTLLPNINTQAQKQNQVQVKLNSINFEGIFKK